MSQRSNALAERLEQGARALASLASGLTEAEWQTPLPRDGRKIGVVIHHVATVYPIEIQLAQTLAGGKSIAGVTPEDIDVMNAEHAREHHHDRKHLCGKQYLLDQIAAGNQHICGFNQRGRKPSPGKNAAEEKQGKGLELTRMRGRQPDVEHE